MRTQPPSPRTGPSLRVRFKAARGLTPRRILRKPLQIPAWVGGEFTFEESAAHTEYETIGAGEFSQTSGGSRSLRRLSGEAMTLTWNPRWLTYRRQDPEVVRRELFKILRSGAAFDFLAVVGPNGRSPELNCLMTLRSIRPRLVSGETDTRYYELELVEYREPTVRRKKHGGKSKLPTKHTLKPGQSFRDLSKRYYGTPEGWRAIARANNFRRWGGKDGIIKSKRFQEGDKVKIPEKPSGIGKASRGKNQGPADLSIEED